MKNGDAAEFMRRCQQGLVALSEVHPMPAERLESRVPP